MRSSVQEDTVFLDQEELVRPLLCRPPIPVYTSLLPLLSVKQQTFNGVSTPFCPLPAPPDAHPRWFGHGVASPVVSPINRDTRGLYRAYTIRAMTCRATRTQGDDGSAGVHRGAPQRGTASVLDLEARIGMHEVLVGSRPPRVCQRRVRGRRRRPAIQAGVRRVAAPTPLPGGFLDFAPARLNIFV